MKYTLKELRARNGLSQGDLARKAGLGLSTIASYEQDISKFQSISYSNLLKVAGILGVDPTEIDMNNVTTQSKIQAPIKITIGHLTRMIMQYGEDKDIGFCLDYFDDNGEKKVEILTYGGVTDADDLPMIRLFSDNFIPMKSVNKEVDVKKLREIIGWGEENEQIQS